jgi:outer membrane protein assembly factor BamB
MAAGKMAPPLAVQRFEGAKPQAAQSEVRSMRRYCAVALVLALVIICAADWPLFRGNPAQDGVSTEKLPDQLAELWQFKCGNGQDSIDGAPAVVDGVAYVAAGDQHLYAIGLADGKEKWRLKTTAPFKPGPAVRNGRVYAGDQDGNFFCVDAKTGKEIWKLQAESEVTSSPSFAGDKIMFGCGDESLYCVDDNGKKIWQFKVPGGPVMGTPAVANGITFVSGCDSKLHVVDIATGKEKTAVELNGQTGATPSLKDGKLYVGSMSADVTAIDLTTNMAIWVFTSNRNQPFFASTAVNDNLVIAGSRDKRIYAIDRATGKKVWDFVTEGRIECSPVIAGERVYVGSLDSNFYVIDLKGHEVQRIKLDSPVTGSVAIAEGRVLVGTQNGTLYCLGKK